jgi:hypothetical protein
MTAEARLAHIFSVCKLSKSIGQGLIFRLPVNYPTTQLERKNAFDLEE